MLLLGRTRTVLLFRVVRNRVYPKKNEQHTHARFVSLYRQCPTSWENGILPGEWGCWCEGCTTEPAPAPNWPHTGIVDATGRQQGPLLLCQGLATASTASERTRNTSTANYAILLLCCLVLSCMASSSLAGLGKNRETRNIVETPRRGADVTGTFQLSFLDAASPSLAGLSSCPTAHCLAHSGQTAPEEQENSSDDE